MCSPVQQATLNWGGDSCQEFGASANSSVFLLIKKIVRSDNVSANFNDYCLSLKFILLYRLYNFKYLEHPYCIII